MAILVVYWTGSGNTGMLAQAVRQGMSEEGAKVDIRNVSDITPSEAVKYDKIAFGCPSMGVEQLEEYEFEPFYAGLKSRLGGKKVVLFGSYGWGDAEWMRYWSDDIQSHGALLVAPGLSVFETPDEEALKAANYLGKILAKA